MCYYVYGALYGKIDKSEYKAIEDKYEFKIHPGTKHDVKMSLLNELNDYRVTDWMCDCDSPLGDGDPKSKYIQIYADLFEEIKKIKGAKHIYLCRSWTGTRNKHETKLKLDEIDIKETLANLERNNLYVFEI